MLRWGSLQMASGDEPWCTRVVASFLERSLSAVYAVVPRTHLDLDPAKAVAKGKDFFRPENKRESLCLWLQFKYWMIVFSTDGRQFSLVIACQMTETLAVQLGKICEEWKKPCRNGNSLRHLELGTQQELVVPLVLVTSVGFVGAKGSRSRDVCLNNWRSLRCYIHHPGGKIRIYASQHCVCETKPDSECLGRNAILCVYLSTIWQFHLLRYSSGQYELHQTHQLDRQTRCVAESSARFGDLRLNDPFPELRRRETSTVRTNVSASQAQCQNWDALIIRRYIVIIIIIIIYNVAMSREVCKQGCFHDGLLRRGLQIQSTLSRSYIPHRVTVDTPGIALRWLLELVSNFNSMDEWCETCLSLANCRNLFNYL